ncbi:DNA mismatch repair protein msh6 [Anaeramoeba flamelloides]|uniref:DNA mismatch repair protein n=1 Tax=Anaeramoeba flamelloides TaxID=1746091 RepID=A0AAV7Y751_9EUKA|nr:DNA mismatch repair protein msh6 [Anaeramoeba flamelloides]
MSKHKQTHLKKKTKSSLQKKSKEELGTNEGGMDMLICEDFDKKKKQINKSTGESKFNKNTKIQKEHYEKINRLSKNKKDINTTPRKEKKTLEIPRSPQSFLKSRQNRTPKHKNRTPPITNFFLSERKLKKHLKKKPAPKRAVKKIFDFEESTKKKKKKKKTKLDQKIGKQKTQKKQIYQVKGSLKNFKFKESIDLEGNEEETPKSKEINKISQKKKEKILQEKKRLEEKKKKQLQLKQKLGKKTGNGAAWFAINNSQNSKYKFLRDIHDLEGRGPDHPDYDCNTLQIEPRYYLNMKPFEKQYWSIKSKNFNVIIFFKKGMFYEFFESDAELAHKLFDLQLSKNTSRKMKMAGIPEKSFTFWASKFIANGFKIGKVEQVETIIQHKKRRPNKESMKNTHSNYSDDDDDDDDYDDDDSEINYREAKKKNTDRKRKINKMAQTAQRSGTQNVLKRELTQILTGGTLIDDKFIIGSNPIYLFSFTERIITLDEVEIGICFVDTSTGIFNVTQFRDNPKDYSIFETILLQIQPKEIVYPQGIISQKLLKFIKHTLNDSQLIFNSIRRENFWDWKKTIEVFQIQRYFFNNKNKNKNKSKNKINKEKLDQDQEKDKEKYNKLYGENFPDLLKKCIEQKEKALLSALGECISYLKTLKIDRKLVSYNNFNYFSPTGMQNSTLSLDSQTLRNLEILQNTTTYTKEGTILELLDHCSTSFGKRKMRTWICRPSINIAAINERLNAVEDLMTKMSNHERKEITIRLRKMPDLERFISRIHTGMCNIDKFLLTLESFEEIHRLMGHLKKKFGKDLRSKKLKSFLNIGENKMFPDLGAPIQKIKDSINVEKTKETGEICPRKGLDPKFDKAKEKVDRIKESLESHLKKYKKKFKANSKQIQFKKLGKQRYLIEIANDVANQNRKLIPKDWILKSETKARKRFWNPFILSTIEKLAEEEDHFQIVKKRLLTTLFHLFSKFNQIWLKSISIISELDIYLSLALAALSFENGIYCKPKFIDPQSINNQQFFEVKGLIHPCVKPKIGQFIPNDITLGDPNSGTHKSSDRKDNNDEDNVGSKEKKKNPLALIIEGPNMAGKSTLLRQNCIAVILAQIGSFVPAESLTLTPVDKIFTRIGASDDLIQGKSTFMVELDETSTILKNVTEKSLVIMDELGRGTTTEDGYSIAYSVLDYLLTKNCRLLFSTHYHSLVQEFHQNAKIGNYHMGYVATKGKKAITLLYKLVPGSCPISFGINVAQMAGIPKFIVDRADTLASKFDKFSNLHHKEKIKRLLELENKLEEMQGEKNKENLNLISEKDVNLLKLITDSSSTQSSKIDPDNWNQLFNWYTNFMNITTINEKK